MDCHGLVRQSFHNDYSRETFKQWTWKILLLARPLHLPQTASSSESLFAVFEPSSNSAPFSSSYSASQSSAAAAVKWVVRSGNKNWDSPM